MTAMNDLNYIMCLFNRTNPHQRPSPKETIQVKKNLTNHGRMETNKSANWVQYRF